VDKNKFNLLGVVMSAKRNEIVDPNSYTKFLEHIKKDIQDSQLRATMSITKELIDLYWRIGKMLSEKVLSESWGSKTMERIVRDLISLFPNISGFSYRNLKFMRQFADSYPQGIRETAVSLIPWGHNILLMQKVQEEKKRLWYAQQAVENGWSRSMMLMWVESNLYERQGKAITNFKKTLPSSESDLAVQMMKDPYNLAFVTLDKNYRERELELGLIEHIQKFLLELGQGFAFVGRQVSLVVDGREYFVDLLFYHLKLRRYIVIEMKAREFDPKDISQINFYMSAVDDHLRNPGDELTIGMIFCKTKQNFTVEYALRDFNKPIGVAEYEVTLVESLSKELRESLPTIEDIEAEFGKNKN